MADLALTDDARNGAEALELHALHRPDIVFLDIHMPGLNGIDTARALARRAHLVFVTAYEQYALQAFEQGAINYLVKPIDGARLADTVERLKRQIQAPAQGSAAMESMLDQLAARLGPRAGPSPQLQWLRPDPSFRHRQSRLCARSRQGNQRDGRPAPATRRRGIAGQPQLSLPLPPDVGMVLRAGIGLRELIQIAYLDEVS